MGSRTRYRIVDQVPAPNTYSLPPVLGPRVPGKASAPAFTVSGRSHHGGHSEDLAVTPGPAHYIQIDNNSYMKKGPAYSMLGRHQVSKKHNLLPQGLELIVLKRQQTTKKEHLCSQWALGTLSTPHLSS
ncbi:unnamed protein product [Staurois parvus]|uniref:Uncharacterized protein n=1 Tax=Staurois parvus TaxID=386267 RepID=A0ABN9CUB1_9NEOB|nr:unnamed protein product [Staurois parvus]